MLGALIQSIPAQRGGYCQFLQEEQQLLDSTGDWYLFHEHLEIAAIGPEYLHGIHGWPGSTSHRTHAGGYVALGTPEGESIVTLAGQSRQQPLYPAT